MVIFEIPSHRLPVHHQVKSDDEHDQEDRRQAVTPDVDALVVDHEQTSEYLSGSVESDTVSMGDVLVVLHVVGCSLVLSNEMGVFFLLLGIDSLRLFWFRLPLLEFSFLWWLLCFVGHYDVIIKIIDLKTVISL